MTGLIATGGGQPACRHDLCRFPEQLQAQIKRINADIEEGSAAEADVKQSSCGIEGCIEAKISPDIFDLADLAGGYQFQDSPCHGQESRPHGFHEEGVVPLGCGDHLSDLAGIQGQRFLTKYRLTMLQTEDAVCGMKTMGGGHIDRVYLRVRSQGGIVMAGV